MQKYRKLDLRWPMASSISDCIATIHFLPLLPFLQHFATFCHFLQLFATFCHFLPLFTTFNHILPLFATFCQF